MSVIFFLFFPQPPMISLHVDDDVRFVRSKLLCSMCKDYSGSISCYFTMLSTRCKQMRNCYISNIGRTGGMLHTK